MEDKPAQSKFAQFADILSTSGLAGRRNQPVAGALWVVTAMGLMAGLIALGRHAALEGMHPMQVMFFRNVFCVLWMLPLLLWRGTSLLWTDQIHLYGARVGLSFVSMSAMFYAASIIPIAEITAIGFLSPLFGTVFAVLLLGETVRLRRWCALAIGFVGALIILRPGLLQVGAGQLAALCSAMALGVIGPLVKKLTLVDDADRVVFITNILLTLLSIPPALLVWQWPPAGLWPYLAALGLCATLGHMALVRGYTSTDASLVMVFKFARLPFAIVIGFLAFGELIDAFTVFGAIVIFASAVYITRREAELATRDSIEKELRGRRE